MVQCPELVQKVKCRVPKYRLYNHKASLGSFMAPYTHKYHRVYICTIKLQQTRNHKVLHDRPLWGVYFKAAYNYFYFNIPVHIFKRVQILHCFANVPKISFDFIFWELTETKFNFVMQSPSLCVLQNHIGHIFLLLIIVVKEANYFRVVKLMVHINLVFRISPMDLS